MAADTVDGVLYLIEADARNQAWTPTPANIDLGTNYAGKEGIEFCKMSLPTQWSKKMTTGLVMGSASGGKGFMTRSFQRTYTVTIFDLETTGTNAAYIEDFIMDDDHTTSDPTAFYQYYLVMRRSVTDFEKFMNASSTMVDYCKGGVIDFEINWHESKNKMCTIRLVFQSNW